MPRAPPKRKSEDGGKPQKIPRPPNAWIIYRTDRLHEWRAARSPNDPPVKQADISRLIAARWKEEPDNIKLDYEKRAAIAKAEHRKKFPDYKYNPISKEAKDKMRAEEREAKKKAREDAKAAKAAARTASYGTRNPSYPSPPSTSQVKLEAFDEKKPSPEPKFKEPIQRGCGPSPPIDYDPQSPSSISSTSLSSSSSASLRSSPLPSSSHLISTPNDASNAWLPHVPSPLSSSPTQQPPPAYPSSYIHSPAPSRQTSYTLLSPSFPPSSSSSTPSDSPPSYTEGDGWQPQPPGSEYQPFAPLPEFQGAWNTFAQYQPLLQPNVSFPLPVTDPLLIMPEDEQINFDSTNLGAIFDLSGPQSASAQSPPGELDMDQLLDFIAAGTQQQGLNSADQLAPMLDMAELHETVEDHTVDAGLPAPDSSQPWTLEDFAAWVNAHPHDALSFADSNFYMNLSLDVAGAYSNVDPPLQQPPPPFDPDTGAQMSAELAPGSEADVLFQQAMQQMFVQQVQHTLAMPVPSRPVIVPDVIPSTVPTPVQMELVSETAAMVQPELVSAPVESAPVPARGRYVPPSGAGMPSRRRVAYRLPPRKLNHDEDSA